LDTLLMDYTYPHVRIRVSCSKGTYIRSIAHDLGEKLGCHAHLSALRRTRSGSYTLADCLDGELRPATEEKREACLKALRKSP